MNFIQIKEVFVDTAVKNKPSQRHTHLKDSVNKTLSVGSLFTGIGGIDQGFIQAGFGIAWANEIDKQACITYRANFQHTLYEADIRTLDPKTCPKVDIIAAGFPCQAFSIAGYQKGFSDDRGNVFFEIMKFVDEHNPQCVFLENVKNIAGHDKGSTLKVIFSELTNRGYHFKYKVLNTAEYGNLPQNRERFYLAAFRNEKAFEAFEFPAPIKLSISIKDLLLHCDEKAFYYKHNQIYPILKEQMTKEDTVYQWRRVYVRENKSNLCPTLTANMGTGGHNVPLVLDNGEIRKLTPRECFRFQGYADSYIMPATLPRSALYKQAGNSVSIPVIKRIAENIQKALKQVAEK